MARTRRNHPASAAKIEWRLRDLWRPQPSTRACGGHGECAQQAIEYARRVVPKLTSGDGYHGETVGDQGRGLQPIPFERDAPRVTVPTIELHRDCEFAPQEVHLIAVDRDVGLKPGDSLPTQEPNHRPLST